MQLEEQEEIDSLEFQVPVKPQLLGVPLVIESHPNNYTGLPFLTLIQYHNKIELVVVDNCTDTQIRAYVLDLCGPENIDEMALLEIAADWYENNSKNYPISIEFAKRGVVHQTVSLLKTFNVDFVSRVIGPVPKYPAGHNSTNKTRRKKKKLIQQSVEIVELFVD